MLRKLALTFVLVGLFVSPCFGQEWARKMFKVTEHDFGSVARGAKAEYRFVFDNIYMEDVHVSGVRTSCGCTTPSVETPLLKTYEQGAILAHFNTDSFLGQRSATLTVSIDKPFVAEVQLQVRGYIRNDVVVEPGSVQFGSIDQGTGYSQVAAVNYSGGGDWKVLEIKSANPHITAKAVETARSEGQVSYQLKVLVDQSTPAGYLNDYLMVVTNDATGQQIPVLVEGRVMPSISVSPPALFMGVVQPGEKVVKQLVVKGREALPHSGRCLRGQVVPIRHLEGNRGEGSAPDPRNVHGRNRCGQSGQDDQDRHRPGSDDARAGGLRRGGGRTVVCQPCRSVLRWLSFNRPRAPVRSGLGLWRRCKGRQVYDALAKTAAHTTAGLVPL